MGSGAMTATTTNAAPRATALAHTGFYLWMAVAMAATAFLGFAPTFWLPLAQGVPQRTGVLAVHGTLFFGGSLAAAMVIFGVLAAIDSGIRAAAMNQAAAGEACMIVPLSAMLSFAV